jgi:hypothetical protein
VGGRGRRMMAAFPVGWKLQRVGGRRRRVVAFPVGWKLLAHRAVLYFLIPNQEERLEGDNRYFCENCQSKQNATRKIRLLSLPCTLNLQLMRFVFDR